MLGTHRAYLVLLLVVMVGKNYTRKNDYLVDHIQETKSVAGAQTCSQKHILTVKNIQNTLSFSTLEQGMLKI